MGLDRNSFGTAMIESSVVIDPKQHKRLGVHLCAYAARNELTDTELVDLLAMVGLTHDFAD